MISYPIGALAERILTLTLDRAGAVTSTSRQRAADGSMKVSAPAARHDLANAPAVDFVARVKSGHSGVVEIRPVSATSTPARTIIPLGADRPFLESELPMSPGANGAYSQSEAIRFSFAAPRLIWTTENMAGEIELTERTPAVAVTLRLPAGNDGDYHFSHTDGLGSHPPSTV